MTELPDAPTVEQLAKCAACAGKACASKQKACEDAYEVTKRVLIVLDRRTNLLRSILAQGRIEQGPLRNAIEEECR